MLPNPIISIGKINVYMYGVMIAIGILGCFIVLYTYSKRFEIAEKMVDFTFYNAIGAIVAGFGAAALFQATYNYIKNPSAGFRLGSGITFIGGLIGGVGFFLIVYFLLKKKMGLRLINILPIAPCCITIAHGMGRIGCFFAGCCYGKPTNSFLGVKFPNLSEKVFPTQLYEAVFLLVLFGVLSYLLLKKDFYNTMALYLISYGTFRFLIEFLRGDNRGKLFNILSPSQFWSVVMIVFGIVLWYVFSKKYNMKKASEVIKNN